MSRAKDVLRTVSEVSGMILTVANMEQKLIFWIEMMGQLSDGYWENSEPRDHWKPWCNIKWNDIKVGSPIGTKGGYPPKRNYSFSAKNLLDIVGDRVVLKINLWKKLGAKIEKVLKDNHWSIPDDGVISDNKREKFAKLGLTKEVMQAAKEGPYTMAQLKKDCKGLSDAFKINLG